MKNPTDDPVAHFGSISREFHSLYEASEAYRERLRVWSDILDRRAPRGGLALDLGCGTGIFAFYLAERGCRVIGVDASDEMIAFCEEQRRQKGMEGVHFRKGRLPDIDGDGLADADLIVSSSLVEFVDDLGGTLDLFARLLKPGGTLVVSMPNALSVSRNVERLQHRLTGKPDIYRFIRHFSDPRLLAHALRRRGLAFEEARHYAHGTRIARLCRKLRLPSFLTEDLFVAVFRKGAASGAK